jgi:hypothetical protein
MKNTNQLGLWMDDSVAYLIQFTTKPLQFKQLCMSSKQKKKNQTLKKFLLLSRYKETSLNKHYNKMGKELLKYEKIVLFGPSTSKLDFLTFK